ncbi:MAG: hypothetical protein EXR72_03105 [Myxococcales bacterium]|nr:hypothetical protein [Myxococcales bacterium]
MCFYIPTAWRGRGVAKALAAAATARAFALGATEVEGYPVVPTKGAIPGPFAWTGVPTLFEGAGYVKLRGGPGARPIYLKRGTRPQ